MHRSGPDSERLRLRRRRECCRIDSDTSEFHVHQLQQRQFQKLGEHSCGGHRAGDGKRQRNTRKLLTPVYGAAGLTGKVLVVLYLHVMCINRVALQLAAIMAGIITSLEYPYVVVYVPISGWPE